MNIDWRKTILDDKATLKQLLHAIEKKIILEAMDEWNLEQTATLLGITRQGLYKKLRVHGIRQIKKQKHRVKWMPLGVPKDFRDYVRSRSAVYIYFSEKAPGPHETAGAPLELFLALLKHPPRLFERLRQFLVENSLIAQAPESSETLKTHLK